MDAAERALLAETVHDALARASQATQDVAAVDALLADLGWLEMLDAEPRDAVDVVFTALGSTNAVATVLDDVVASALGVGPRVAPRADLAVLLPCFAAWAPPGSVAGSDVHAIGLATSRVGTAEEILVAYAGDASGGGGVGVSVATVPIADAEVTAVRGIDPDARLHLVRVAGAAGSPTPVDAGAWDAAVAAGRRAVGHQISGACRTMLALACEHALERLQFGRPIAQFQAVRHRLADALVAIEALDASLSAAWDEPSPMTAALAKAVAGRTARTVAAHCQQVLAGIGFTTEHPFHRYLKRTMALEGFFGSTDEIVVDLGRALLASRTVPALIEL
jgi:hypothetical protein